MKGMNVGVSSQRVGVVLPRARISLFLAGSLGETTPQGQGESIALIAGPIYGAGGGDGATGSALTGFSPRTTRTRWVAPSLTRDRLAGPGARSTPSTSIVAMPRVIPCGFSTAIS